MVKRKIKNYEYRKSFWMAFSEYVLGSHSYNFDYSYYENWIQLEILVNKLIIDINSKIALDIMF